MLWKWLSLIVHKKMHVLLINSTCCNMFYWKKTLSSGIPTKVAFVILNFVFSSVCKCIPNVAMVVSGQLEGEITIQHFERYATLGAKSQTSLHEIARFALILVQSTLWNKIANGWLCNYKQWVKENSCQILNNFPINLCNSNVRKMFRRWRIEYFFSLFLSLPF